MQVTDTYTVVKAERGPAPKIELVGTFRSITLDAVQLISQYKTIQGDTLLILDEDCPYEEQLHLVLLRSDMIIDYILIGAPYTAGIFREIDARDNRLRFTFTSDEILEVQALSMPSRWPTRLPSGTRRRMGLLAPRYLNLVHQSEIV